MSHLQPMIPPHPLSYSPVIEVFWVCCVCLVSAFFDTVVKFLECGRTIGEEGREDRLAARVQKNGRKAVKECARRGSITKNATGIRCAMVGWRVGAFLAECGCHWILSLSFLHQNTPPPSVPKDASGFREHSPGERKTILIDNRFSSSSSLSRLAGPFNFNPY